MSLVKALFLVFLAIGCIGLIITLSIVLTRNPYECHLDSDIISITGITFKQLDTRDVLVTWDRPYEMNTCHQGYEVTYSSINGEITTTTQAESVTIPGRNICFGFDITIRPIPAGSDLSSGNATFHVEPEKLGYINYTEIVTRDNEMEISWQLIESVRTCNFTYQVVFTTDLSKFTQATEQPNIVFLRDFFCFDVKAVIQAVVNGRAVAIGNTGGTYGISPVDDLELSVFNANGRIRATWSHPFLECCGVDYEVRFLLGNRTAFTFTKSIPNINFDLYYCVRTTVDVRALRSDGGASEARNVTNSGGYPTSLEPVQNVSISRNGTFAVVSWETSNFVIYCDDLYTVTATNTETSEETKCQGTTGCNILLTTLCPQIIFSIKPTYLKGEEVLKTLTC